MRRRKRSWPSFWILGFLGSCLLIFAGINFVMGFAEAVKKDSGMLYCGIFFILLGLGLLIGVIGTFYTLIIKGGGKDDSDFSITVNMDQDINKKKYSAENLVRKVSYGRNNVVTINTGEGYLRFYGYNGRFITEIRIGNEGDFHNHHMIDPEQADTSVTVLGTVFEKFPTRKNRILSNDMVASAVQKLYDAKSLDQVLYSFSWVDTTEETKNLMMKDAYITPEVPIVVVSPTSEEGMKRAEKVQRAMQELQRG